MNQRAELSGMAGSHRDGVPLERVPLGWSVACVVVLVVSGSQASLVARGTNANGELSVCSPGSR